MADTKEFTVRRGKLLRERVALVKEFEQKAERYAYDSVAGYGVAATAGELHKLIDRITSHVYDAEFAYCGRTHSVI